jgi:type IV secretory pathway VirD2 relaxase
MTSDDRFEVRLGKVRSSSGSRRAVSFFKQVRRGARVRGVQRTSGRSGARPMPFYRRVVIKASIKVHAGGRHIGLRKHLTYIERDGTDENGDRAKLYGSEVDRAAEIDANIDGMSDAKAVHESWKDDRHHFRFIIAPEDSAQLSDLSAYTRDLVGKMEVELGTKLDWVAANHYDTGNPHTHIIVRGVRDNGKDLVIPRAYIAHGMRRDAQDLVGLELGPITQREGRVRLAKTVMAERVTELDRTLETQRQNGGVDLSSPVDKGRVWHKQLLQRRLGHLATMGLAERQGSGRWSVKADFLDQLEKMGAHNDVVKTIHRVLGRESLSVPVTEDNIFNPNRVGAEATTGVVMAYGKMDDTRTNGFVVIEALDGNIVHAIIDDDETFETLRNGQVVTFTPHANGARKIDHSIAAFAKRNGGIYSEVGHVTEGEKVSPAYAQAHVRRLEALRRKNIVTRNQDGTWRIPDDYLSRAENYEVERTRRMPTFVRRETRQVLKEMETAKGSTWLDKRLATHGVEGIQSERVRNSLQLRAKTLIAMGLAVGLDGQLPVSAIETLRDADLVEAGETLKDRIGKPFSAIGSARRVDGIYRQAVDRPSGKFAVIERSKDFTLVPWRPVMEKRLGQSIAGNIGAGGISWDVMGRKGLSR